MPALQRDLHKQSRTRDHRLAFMNFATRGSEFLGRLKVES